MRSSVIVSLAIIRSVSVSSFSVEAAGYRAVFARVKVWNQHKLHTFFPGKIIVPASDFIPLSLFSRFQMLKTVYWFNNSSSYGQYPVKTSKPKYLRTNYLYLKLKITRLNNHECLFNAC